MSLFIDKPFRSHAGLKLPWKLECDALTDEDIETIAKIIYRRLEPLNKVIGIPRGGMRLASALQKYVIDDQRASTLIVDDVYTTGMSMEKARLEHPGALGAVIFARIQTPLWINPLFVLGGTYWDWS